MEDLSLHILDIAENSIAAKADLINIEIVEDERADTLTIRITDNGVGMDEETLKRVLDPFFTTKRVRNFGLGIPLLAQSAEECNGRLSIISTPGGGTKIQATFQRSHMDMKPLGDLGATIVTLIAGHPEIDYELIYKKADYTYEINTAELKRGLEDQDITSPPILDFIKNHVNSGISHC